MTTDRVEEELNRCIEFLVQYAQDRGETYTPDQLADIRAELEGFFLTGQDYGERGDEAFD